MDRFDQQHFKDYNSKGLKSIYDTRKPKLTLKHINRLKKIQSIRTLDSLKRQDLITVMYGVPDESGGI